MEKVQNMMANLDMRENLKMEKKMDWGKYIK